MNSSCSTISFIVNEVQTQQDRKKLIQYNFIRKIREKFIIHLQR